MDHLQIAQVLSWTTIIWWVIIGMLLLFAMFTFFAFLAFGALWVQAFAASARVSIFSLIECTSVK